MALAILVTACLCERPFESSSPVTQSVCSSTEPGSPWTLLESLSSKSSRVLLFFASYSSRDSRRVLRCSFLSNALSSAGLKSRKRAIDGVLVAHRVAQIFYSVPHCWFGFLAFLLVVFVLVDQFTLSGDLLGEVLKCFSNLFGVAFVFVGNGLDEFGFRFTAYDGLVLLLWHANERSIGIVRVGRENAG